MYVLLYLCIIECLAHCLTGPAMLTGTGTKDCDRERAVVRDRDHDQEQEWAENYNLKYTRIL